jgi:hypothetical protein
MIANAGGESLDEAFKLVRDLDLSLGEQLRAFADATRQRTPDFAAAVDRLVERLRRYGAGDAASRVGEPCRRSSCRTTPDKGGQPWERERARMPS